MPDDPTSEGTTAQAERGPEEEKFDPFSVGQDELKTKIESALYPDDADEHTAEPAEEAEEASTSEVEEAESEVVEVEAAEEGEPEAEEPADAIPTEADELRAMLEATQAEAKHFESLLGNRAGEEGFFKQEAAKLRAEVQDLRGKVSQGGYPEETPEAPAPPPAPRATADPKTAYLVSLALKDAGQTFYQSTPEVFVKNEAGQQVIDPDFQKEFDAVSGKVEQILETDDPVFAATEATRLLSAAWAKVDRNRKQARVEDIRRKRAAQGERLKAKKRAAASASTGAPSARTPKRAVDPYKMPMDELKKLADKEAEEQGL